MRERAADILPLLLAVIVPLAGLVLVGERLVAHDREQALRIGLATVIGICLYAALFSL